MASPLEKTDNKFPQIKPPSDGEYLVKTRLGAFVQKAWYISRKEIFVELDGSRTVDVI